MTESSYPGGAKAVDEHIGERITDLARDLRDGFGRQERANDRIEAKFDKMVTQSEFNATILRLDGQDKAIEEKIDQGLTLVSNEVKAGFRATADADKARTTKTRWLIGAGVAGLGLVNAVIFNLIGLFIRP